MRARLIANPAKALSPALCPMPVCAAATAAYRGAQPAATDQLADLLFATERSAAENLAREGSAASPSARTLEWP